MRCRVCNVVIPRGRLAALPNTDVCVKHSQVVAKNDKTVDLATQDREDSQRVVSQPPSETGRR